MLRVMLVRALGAAVLLIGAALLVWFLYNMLWPGEGFQRGFVSLVQLVLLIVLLLIGRRWQRYEGPGIEETALGFDCPELVQAVSRARGTLPCFIGEVEKRAGEAYVKFPLKLGGDRVEHIWAYVHSCRDGKFSVSLPGVQCDPEAPTQGCRDVAVDDVEDWQIMLPDGRIRGAYSLMALFYNRENRGKKLSPKMLRQRAQLVDIAT